jgi:hypothetical protein
VNDDLIITQIGLIFSQVRYLRMALDQVERSTARYAGVALDVAAAGPGQWGAPPLVQGALEVFVVNIGDLIAPDNSFFGVITSVFRMITAGITGAVGGFISGIALPVILGELAAILANIVQIMQLVGFSGKKGPEGTDKPEQSGTFTALLDRLDGTAHTLAQILGLANTEQDKGKPNGGLDANVWLQTMQTVDRIVQGLNLLLPNLIGAFAALLVRIDNLKVIILDLLEFLVRNVLILRGIILLTLYDTIASAARLASELLGIIARGAGTILEAFFKLVDTALSGILEAIRFLSSALTGMVNALLPWLVTTVFGLLNGLGSLPIFRMMFAVVEMMPVLLPALLNLIPGGGTVTGSQQTVLDDAHDRMIAGLASATTPPPTPPPLPDFASLPGVADAFTNASTAVKGITDSLRTEVPTMLTSAGTMLNNVATSMQNAIGPNGENLNRGIENGVGAITDNAKTLADRLRETQDMARKTGGTGLEAIAGAYEDWLSHKGLDDIMGRITNYIQGSPAASSGPTSLLGQVVQAARSLAELLEGGPREPARPTVEIKEVIVEISAPAAAIRERPHRSQAEEPEPVDPDETLPPAERYARGDWAYA